MGDHRAEPASAAVVTPSASRAGRRRADVPVDSSSTLTAADHTPYVGRRVAVLEREPIAAPRPPAEPGGSSGSAAFPFGDDTMERVLGALEPVDHSTDFGTEPTERLPLVRVEDLRPEDTQTLVLDPALFETPATALTGQAGRTAGRRRAVKTRTRRPPILRSLPSAPVLLGLAALAVSVGGTLTVHDRTATDTAAQTVTPASALSGTSRIGHVGGRGAVVTRDSDRQAQANDADPLAAAANGLAAQRTSALEKFDRQSAAYAKVLKSNQWVTPITPGDYHLTARFGQYGLWASFHTGLDFAAPTGTPIHAIASGTVIFAQYDGAYGNKTIVRLADGTELWYCHQNQFGVSVGDSVTQGETIGYVGSTGHVTGPHVHIEVHPGGGDPVDPFPAFVQHGITP